MQSEAARRTGEPSGNGEEASSEGLGGHYLLRPDRCAPSSGLGYAPSPGRPARRRWRRNGKAAGSAFLGHPRESPRGRIHIMTLERTNENINKAESARMTDAVIKSAKALRRLYSMRLVGTPLAHETQGDGRAGGHRQAAARSRPRHRLGQRRRDRRRNPHRVLRRSGDRIT